MPPPPGREPSVSMMLLGLRTKCWRCGEATTAIVGLLRPGGDYDEMLDATQPELLAEVSHLLSCDVTEREMVGAIKPRFSRAVSGSYLSNGCYWCDALQGAFPLNDEVTDVLANEGVRGLRPLTDVRLPAATAARLIAEHYGEFDDD